MIGANKKDFKYLLLQNGDVVKENDEYYNNHNDEWRKVDSELLDDEDHFIGQEYDFDEMKPIRRKNPDYIEGIQPFTIH